MVILKLKQIKLKKLAEEGEGGEEEAEGPGTHHDVRGVLQATAHHHHQDQDQHHQDQDHHYQDQYHGQHHQDQDHHYQDDNSKL